jgi:carbamoyltransferase
VHDRYVLAVSISHNASAALMRNGAIIAAAQEERFCRRKNYVGYPAQSIDFCLSRAGIDSARLDRIAYASTRSSGLFTKAKVTTEFSLRDYMDYYGDRYYRRLIRGDDCTDYLRWLNSAEQFNPNHEYFDFSYLTDEVLRDPELDVVLFRAEQARRLGEHLAIDPERIEFLDHHTCHAYYAYYGSPFREQDCIVLTLDGWGDGRNLTVWRASQDRLSLLAESSENDLGRVYKFATLLLAMRPDEHEYKVMGLAPYAKSSRIAAALEAIGNISAIDGLRIVAKHRPGDLWGHLEEAWRDQRFDDIAGAVQAFTEDLARNWVASVARQTGVGRFVLSGGIAMNVKMNKAIAELDEVESFFVCGSGADESLSIGGCYVLNESAGDNAPLDDLFLGYDAARDGGDLIASGLGDRYEISMANDPTRIATLLAAGDIVAVIRGRAEFGARALGNRSILAHPGRRDAVKRINEAIKNRDFWMPFAVSILEEFQHEFIVNPKGLASPFMTLSFDTVPERYHEIEAGTHPYDRTVRPQLVSARTAPEFHRLIAEFDRLTGTPALLNTSFNLHGEPIVNGVADAVRTFELSGIDHLAIGDGVLVSKRAEWSA